MRRSMVQRCLVSITLPVVVLCGTIEVTTVRTAAGGIGQVGDGGTVSSEEVWKHYNESASEWTMLERYRGIADLATLGDEKSLTTLIERYFKTEKPNPHLAYRYLIADVCCEAQNLYFAGLADHFKNWLIRADKDWDCWLHHLVARKLLDFEEDEYVLSLLRNKKTPALFRAAMLNGTAKRRDQKWIEVLPEVFSSLPGKGVGRDAIVEACANVISDYKGERDEGFDRALAALVGVFESSLSERTQLVLARRLSVVLDIKTLYKKKKHWLDALKGAPLPSNVSSSESFPLNAGFLGVGSTGSRIVFVLDASDSMLKPLKADEVEQIKKRVITHRKRDGAEPADKPEKPSHRNDLNDDLPWDKIKTRFDAAREALVLALKQLDSKTSFCVVVFGTEARYLASTPGLMPADKKLVAKVIADLGSIKATPPRENENIGRLLGATNIHDAFLLAFRAANGTGYTGEDEHSNERTVREGADTIYFLSDGKATANGFIEECREREVVYPAEPARPAREVTRHTPEGREYKVKIPAQPATPERREIVRGEDWGPYVDAACYVSDIARMNVIRNVEIHCIGIGEASPLTLQDIAAIGRGTFSSIGKLLE